MKYAGSSVEAALLTHMGPDGFCAGGIAEIGRDWEYPSRNNKFQEDGEEKTRFHQHTWPDLFFVRIAAAGDWDDYHKITIVRNPWDAVVSYYWWCIREWNLSPDYPDLVIAKSDDQITAQMKFGLAMDLASQYTGDTIAWEMGLHHEEISALIFLGEVNNRFVDPRIDTYLRFESIQVDYDDLCNGLGIASQVLPRFKTGIRKLPYHYSYYYNDELRDRVYRHFKALITQFGYTFDAPYTGKKWGVKTDDD